MGVYGWGNYNFDPPTRPSEAGKLDTPSVGAIQSKLFQFYLLLVCLLYFII